MNNITTIKQSNFPQVEEFINLVLCSHYNDYTRRCSGAVTESVTLSDPVSIHQDCASAYSWTPTSKIKSLKVNCLITQHIMSWLSSRWQQSEQQNWHKKDTQKLHPLVRTSFSFLLRATCCLKETSFTCYNARQLHTAQTHIVSVIG